MRQMKMILIRNTSHLKVCKWLTAQISPTKWLMSTWLCKIGPIICTKILDRSTLKDLTTFSKNQPSPQIVSSMPWLCSGTVSLTPLKTCLVHWCSTRLPASTPTQMKSKLTSLTSPFQQTKFSNQWVTQVILWPLPTGWWLWQDC